MTYDEFKLQGLEEFAEYCYYKGEKECPYKSQSIEVIWWDFERRYHEGPRKDGRWKNFNDYFDSWVRDRAAPETGWDLARGNRWRKEYEEHKPYCIRNKGAKIGTKPNTKHMRDKFSH